MLCVGGMEDSGQVVLVWVWEGEGDWCVGKGGWRGKWEVGSQ